MAEETSEYSETTGDGIGRFGEMSMDAQIAEASGISGIIECVTELPEPAAGLADKTYQLIAVQPPYVMGRFYKCFSSGGAYSWKDVSEVQVSNRTHTVLEIFRLVGNEVRFQWIDLPRTKFIKSEIQLVYHDATGAVKSAKTIFTKPTSNSSIYGAAVVVDGYTARGITQGKITLRVRSTYVGLVIICNLRKLP